MASTLQLPVINLSSPDRISTAHAIRQACTEYGFFYLINHGVEQSLVCEVFERSKDFFSLSTEEKTKLLHKHHRGYTPLYAEKLDPSVTSRGDSKESFYIGPLELSDFNQWPSEEKLPSWKATMETYYKRVMDVGKKSVSMIALALNLDEDFFDKAGALNPPEGFLRLLHYPAVDIDPLGTSDQLVYGASAHSDYGMITLLMTDGVPGLQVCREKHRQPQIWEDVPYLNGAFIVNVGDLTERWTNCLFQSTLHRVMPTGSERFSIAFFLDPNPDCMVKCMESCCNETSPCRFPPIRAGDYLVERLREAYSDQNFKL